MSKTKKNNRSPGGDSSSSRCCSSPSPSSATSFTTSTSSTSSTSSTTSPFSAESMRLIHNNLNHNHHPQANQPQQQLISRMSTVRRLLTITFLLLLICAVTLFSLHQIQQILQHQEHQEAGLNSKEKGSHQSPPSPPSPDHPPPQPLPLSKAEPLLYRALLQKTTALNSLEQKRSFIRSMAREAWTAYTRLAWGHEAVRPLTGEPYDSDWFSTSTSSSKNDSKKVRHLSGRTIVSSASSLWLMGLRHEYEQARHWIATQLDPLGGKPQQTIASSKLGLYFAVGETLGGLLSCYALTGDLLFLDKAVATASALKPAYSIPGGLLYSDLGPPLLNQSNSAAPPPHPLDVNSFLWIASQNLEYLYLLELTGACEYGRRVAEMRSRIWSLLETQEHLQNLETNYLLHFAKAFRQSAGEDYEAFRLYNRSLERLKSGMRRSRTGLLYVRELDYDENYGNHKKEPSTTDWMETDSCCLASLVAIGARLKNGTVLERELALAAALVETCHQAAKRSATGLSPARFYFNDRDDATNQYGDAAHRFNFLGPELAEAYFLLYRLTKNGKYQAYAWELAQAIHRHCRAADSGAYSVVASVEQTAPPEQMLLIGSNDEETVGKQLGDLLNRQPSYFIGATLKYLYLTFSEEEVAPLEQWTFNALGQPLPIRRTKVGGGGTGGRRCAS